MKHRRSTSPRLAGLVAAVTLGGALVGGAAFVVSIRPVVTSTTVVPTTSTTTSPTTTSTSVFTPSSTTTTTTAREEGQVPAMSVFEPWGSGVTMFRGNPTRTWYGTGPVPEEAPEVLWAYPDAAMCATSTAGGETKLWCGTGWTGQPVIWERPDGITELIFGAYDRAVHFVDAGTGEPTRLPFVTGDIIKGSVTLDPDGYPFIYFGSRDNKLRIVSIAGEQPVELWSLDASAVAGIWNNDWDGNPVIVDDVMYVGGENGWFFAVKLNRDAATVAPEVLFQMPGWTDQLLADVGRNVSIESSVAVWERRVYFANSGGRVVGLDASEVHEGRMEVVFDYRMGDDVDATITIDREGRLYVAAEYERGTARADEVGQLVKLDPFTDGDPRIWGVPVPPVGGGDGGIWATPALGDGYVYAATHTGRLLGVDADSGDVVWEDEIGFHAWSSPLIVDGHLIVATCDPPMIRSYSLARPHSPELSWTVEEAAGGCIESTPVIWNGQIYVGSRDGYMRAYGASR